MKTIIIRVNGAENLCAKNSVICRTLIENGYYLVNTGILFLQEDIINKAIESNANVILSGCGKDYHTLWEKRLKAGINEVLLDVNNYVVNKQDFFNEIKI